jgi:hypothetical protein
LLQLFDLCDILRKIRHLAWQDTSMIVGFNHNVKYKAEMFHIQTEDSGICNPHIITLLYRGGTIISSRKTSYADIVKMENLEQVVEELMKEQHKDMLRRLKSGEFDERAFSHRAADAEPERTAEVAPPKPTAAQPPPASPAESPAPPPNPDNEAARPRHSLDEIILDYLVAGDDK